MLTRPLVLALIALSACEGKPRPSEQLPAPAATGPAAPPFAGRTLDGEPFELVGQRGQVVLLNVWATWCEPCRREMPELQALHTRHRAQGFTVVGVSVDAHALTRSTSRVARRSRRRRSSSLPRSCSRRCSKTSSTARRMPRRTASKS